MNRNVESHFSYLPNANIGRSRFDMSHKVSGSCNVGSLIPFECLEVLPGDTFKMDTSKVLRLQTLINPIFGNLYADFYWFFIPNRILWEHWREFMGEATQSAWIDPVEYTPPVVKAPSGGWNVGTIADYLGVPPKVDNIEVSAMWFRAYAKVVDDWFRDENLQQPPVIPLNDTDVTGTNGSGLDDLAKGGMPFTVAKYHDYFTSALPEPQKGPDVPIPAGTIKTEGYIPVFGNGNALGLTSTFGTTSPKVAGLTSSSGDLGAISGAYSSQVGTTGSTGTLLDDSSVGVVTKAQIEALNPGADPMPYAQSGLQGYLQNAGVSLSLGTINELREAFQIQKFYEKLALGGSRYIEIIKSMFGVDSPDGRLQRSEYLGGNRVLLSVSQIVQNSATQAGQTPLGTVSAYSLTNDRHHDFVKSFTEHGILLGLFCVRYPHSYQQGLHQKFTRKNKFDYYWPVFANIGNQPIFNREIFVQGSSAVNPVTGVPYDDEVFGYQEAWATYRYVEDSVHGELRSVASNSLDGWHLADDYATMPYLGSSWIQEDKTNVDRVLAVQSSVSNQVLYDIGIKNIATRPMPLYSIPGLIDHH